jgi:NAD(P)-dependent dehydrogenase (short-subunit alcohol dehydrogenase family)
VKDLTAKVAVVTGGGSGIGRATALALARAGSAVAVCDLDEAQALQTVRSIADEGGRATVHQVDVAVEGRMRALVGEVLAEHGVVDVVVNNAGVGSPVTRAVDIDLSHFRRVVDINFWGVVYGSLFFGPELLDRPEANLVNVASNASFTGYSRMAMYCASKFAVRGFTESLRMELRNTPVKVTVVCPGLTRTAIMANSPVMEIADRQAMQRAFDGGWGRPPEVVGQAIVNAIRKDQPRCLVGPDTRVLDFLTRLTPGRYGNLLGPGIEMGTNKLLARAARSTPG